MKEQKLTEIKLTKIQVKNLLTMANVLFRFRYGKFFKILDRDIYYSKNGKFPGWSIHWYEFCCTHLLEDLIVWNFNGTIDDVIFEEDKKSFFIDVMLDNQHPVDWLWNYYKKIPKGQ